MQNEGVRVQIDVIEKREGSKQRRCERGRVGERARLAKGRK